MRTLLVSLALLCSCASTPQVADEAAASTTQVEVVGKVVSACGPEPLQREPVALRAAGELEVLSSTETDAHGDFRFDVVAPLTPLFIEARGVKTVAKPTKRGLIAELVLPCTGG